MTRPAAARKAPAVPDEADLHEAALRYLTRYAASVAGVVRVLDRRVARWARLAGGEAEQVAAGRRAARVVAARLAAAGVLDDGAFATARAKTLARAGKSRRAISAHLAARGVDHAAVRAVLPGGEAQDFVAAVATMRRRRIGPFRATEEVEQDRFRRELGMLARAGFAERLARAALALPREEAEAMLARRAAD